VKLFIFTVGYFVCLLIILYIVNNKYLEQFARFCC